MTKIKKPKKKKNFFFFLKKRKGDPYFKLKFFFFFFKRKGGPLPKTYFKFLSPSIIDTTNSVLTKLIPIKSKYSILNSILINLSKCSKNT